MALLIRFPRRRQVIVRILTRPGKSVGSRSTSWTSTDARTRSGDPCKPPAIRDYERNLRLRIFPALGDRRTREVTTPEVQKLVDDLVKAGLASATIDAALTPLKDLYRRAVARGEVKSNSTQGVEKPAV